MNTDERIHIYCRNFGTEYNINRDAGFDKQMLLSSPNSAQIVLDDNKYFNTHYFIQNQLNDDHHAIIFFC
jgi:hypothetical protein